jgi:hypothetical protein
LQLTDGRTRIDRRILKKGRRPNVGRIWREAVLVVKHEELLARQRVALGAPCLIGFAAMRLPSSGSFAAVMAREYCKMSRVARRNHVKTEKPGFGDARAAKACIFNFEVLLKSQRQKSLYGLWVTVLK